MANKIKMVMAADEQITKTKRTLKAMSILALPSPLTVDGAYVWFQALALIFLAATIITGFGTMVTGYIANKRVSIALAAQQERAANAEKALIEVQNDTAFRHFTKEQRDQFASAVSEEYDKLDIPPISVDVLYANQNPEAAAFALDVKDALVQSRGLMVNNVAPFDISPMVINRGRGAMFGVWVETFDPLEDFKAGRLIKPPEWGMIMKAFASVGITANSTGISLKDIPPNALTRIIIAAKPSSRLQTQLEREEAERKQEEQKFREEIERRKRERKPPPRP